MFIQHYVAYFIELYYINNNRKIQPLIFYKSVEKATHKPTYVGRDIFMSEDRRIRKTREVLKNSFFSLLSQKSVNQITVKEIVELADINRSTFYHYYSDVSNMLVCIEEDIYQQFVDLISENLKKKIERKTTSHTTTSLDFLADIGTIAKNNSAFCRCIFSDYGDIAFLNRLNNLIELNTKELFNELFERNYKEGAFLYSFIKGGVLGILKRWMDNDFNESPEEISIITYELIRSLIETSTIPSSVNHHA